MLETILLLFSISLPLDNWIYISFWNRLLSYYLLLSINIYILEISSNNMYITYHNIDITSIIFNNLSVHILYFYFNIYINGNNL